MPTTTKAARMAIPKSPIPVTAGTFETYHWGGDTIGERAGLGRRMRICIFISTG